MNPPRSKLALLNWLAISPLITLLLSVVLVPTMTFVVRPRLTWVFRSWLPCGPQAAPSRIQEE